ncbi:lycopene cyclase family protein [Gracilimonas sediminicola]|uniref:Lycopene cyclase family protein n=1 Tax=Gracilimonas sediminicola TaxID=2952158 RepID=A0A9X2L0W8_9BACT|nr:lycopene cyclase family protein [Gracilimonas sediminicola]MCP9290303.1 lycopene cyclase family protein [Gracilimonas sediminicola]
MKIEAKYDVIIAGGGLSGLSLAWYLAKGNYKGEVLVTDSTFAPTNDKTWCFWSNKEPPFRDVIYKKWKKTWVSVLDYSTFRYLNEYSYYCIRSGDFREYVLRELKKHKNFDLLEDNILDFSSNQSKAVMLTKGGDSYIANYIFQSIMKPKDLDRSQIKYPLIQHFLGWEIKTYEPAFDPETFTIMDFDNEFEPGVGFMYVLPYTQSKALLEFTVFSEDVLKKKKYKKKIKHYLLHELGLDKDHYEIRRKEYGEIPMEDRPHVPYYDKNIINLGSVGGQTKPSTGYTFTRIQDYTQKLAQNLIQGFEPLPPQQSKLKYRYYDLLLLHILSNSTNDSLRVFRSLFKKNNFDDIFRFLGEDTNLRQDLKIMSSVPYIPFFKAIWKNL